MNQKYLKSLLKYDRITGIFTWINPSKYHPRMKGKIAGCKGTGYILIRVDGKKWKAHKLAWLYVYGKLPSRDLDHKDTDTFNNAIKNLRLCTMAQNQANKERKKKKNLQKGVSFIGDKFQAKIPFN